MKRAIAIGSAALVAALLFLAWETADHPVADSQPSVEAGISGVDTASQQPVVSTAKIDSAATSTSSHRADPDSLVQLRQRYAASSLRGTVPDGGIAFDARGALRLDANLVRRFEHYLSLVGEFELHEIRALLQAQLQDELGESAAAAAIAAFDRYVGLREAISATELSADLATRLEQLRALRRHWFGADAESMFGAEETEVEYTLARSALQRDSQLSDEQRATRLAELEAARDPRENAIQRDATSAALVDEQTRQFDAMNADAATRAEERAALWGEDAAQRLAELDRARAEWDRRVSEYLAERQQLEARPDLDVAARQQALSALRARRFDAAERQRIEALEAIGALPPGG
jgi:lipase chaperone LimK